MNAIINDSLFSRKLRGADAAPLPGSARSQKALWAGRALSGLAAAFLAMDAVMKVLALPPAIQATTELGYPASVVVTLGMVQLVCLALYVIPRTALMGAILLTGYLGGAIATHVRVNNPLFSHALFPLYVAAFVWAGLWLRDRRVDALLANPSSLHR